MSEETVDPVAAYMSEHGAAVFDRLNDDFEDSMVWVARVLTPRSTATRSVVTAVDQHGVDLSIRDGHGDHRERLNFDRPIESPAELTTALFGLVVAARAANPTAPRTSAEREFTELARIRTFLTTVESVEDVHPRLRRVTCAGGDLSQFSTTGPDTFVYLLVAPPGCEHLAIDQSFTWDQHAALPEAVRPVGAYYTVRHWDPLTTQLEILVVMHEGGAGSAWAARTLPGETVALWGPRTAYNPPPDTRHLLLAADETGLPAVASILDHLPKGTTAQVLAEVGAEDERQTLPQRDGVDVRWLYRDGSEPGTTDLLVNAARTLPPLPPNTYVWGGGESRAMTALRRHVRDDRGMERASVSLVAYWRRS